MTEANPASALVRLGDLFRIKHGFAFKGEFFSDEAGDIVLTPGNFQDRGGLKFKAEKDRSYTGNYPAEYKLSANDLLVVMTDLTQEARILGAPAFVPSGVCCLHNQRLGKIVDVNSDRLDRRFLYYVLNGHDYREYLRATATGSTVKHTSPGRISDFRLFLPRLHEQQRIASILSAYDDLIEVNRRRVVILEEMARRLFDEWFVHLRFPGHDTVPVHGTPDGPLPDGWTYKSMDCVAELKGGDGKLTKASYTDRGYTAYSASGPDGCLPSFSCSGPAVIVSAVGAYCGRTWLASGNWTGIANTFYLRPAAHVSCES